MTQQPTPAELMAGLKRSATTIQRLKAELSGYHEPIAIVGMGCRFPGDINTPAVYWERLRDGVSAVGTAPWQRWGIERNHNSSATNVESLPELYGHYLSAVGHFDAHFFGISPREAAGMDPQQQLLLEVGIEALEHANLPMDQLLASRTGVYIGIMNVDHMQSEQTGDETDVYAATGSGISFPAGRLSYTLGLRGPSMAIGTACSSSLVTTHLACQALRAKECDLALSGGVSLILAPDSDVVFAKMQATAPDGRSKTFDAAADGYGRGEGCGLLVLKRLSDAQRDGDTIWALIRGSAVNHDGRSGGLTVPNGRAQEELLHQALATTRVNAQEIDYIEAHGTGTVVGDPIEMRALGNVLGADRQNPLLVGSVKTNIGHLEPAAGIAGLMKVILSLRNRQIPPHLHFQEPNPLIPWDEYPLQVPTTLTDWEPAGPRLAGVSSFGLSGINAHVILEEAPVLDEDKEEQSEANNQENSVSATRSRHLLTLSAKSAEALRALAKRYQDDCFADPHDTLDDLCYTSHVGRMHYPHRLAVVGSSVDDMRAQLTSYLQQEANALVVTGQTADARPKIAFLFTGQGSQYVDMGRELYATSATFRATIDRCEELLRDEMGESLLAILYPETRERQQKTNNKKQKTENRREGRGETGDTRYETGDGGRGTGDTQPATRNPLDDTTYTQPALFALEYALAMLWQSWGIAPTVLIGHSVGEIVAACVAGVFSLEDGLKLIAARGRLMGALPQDGEMLAVLADEARVQQAIARYHADVSIAAVNGPESVVVSGKREAIQAIADQLTTAGIKTRKLAVSHAFHSPLVEPMLDDFAAIAKTISYHPPRIPIVSNVAGTLYAQRAPAQGSVTEREPSGREVTDWQYWVNHVREPVRFAAGIATLQEQGIDIFLEIGPKPTLLGMTKAIYAHEVAAKQHLGFTAHEVATCDNYDDHGEGGADLVNRKSKLVNPVLLPSLRAGQHDWQSLLASLGALYVHGLPINWDEVDRDMARRKVQLPTYPFQRQQYWTAPVKQQVASLRPLIDRKVRVPRHQETIFEKEFSTQTLPFLADHRVYGEVVVPGATHLAMALSAADLLFDGAPCELQDILFPQALALPEGETRTVQLITDGKGEHSDERNTTAAGLPFQLTSFADYDSDDDSRLHASGRIAPLNNTAPILSLTELQERCDEPLSSATLYSTIATMNIALGPTFYWIAELWQGREHEALARLQRPDALLSVQGYRLFPSLIDACFQLVGAATLGDGLDGMDVASSGETQLPFALTSLRLYATADHQELWCHTRCMDDAKWDIVLLTATGEVVAEITGFQLRSVSADAIHGDRLRTDWLYMLDWRPEPLALAGEPAQSPDCWLVFGATAGVSKQLTTALAADRVPTTLITPGSAFALGVDSNGNKTQIATVDPDDPAMMKQLLTELATDYRSVGIAYLWGIDDALNTNDLPTYSLQLTAGLLHLVQALTATELDTRLWLVTQECQVVPTPDEANATISLNGHHGQHAASGAIWGLGRTIALEHPRLHCTCIDLQGNALEQQGMALYRELVTGFVVTQADTQILYQDDVRHVARLAHWQSSPAHNNTTALTLSDDGSYLITGGLGALGLQIAQQLVEEGAQRLLLTGRRGVTTDEQREAVAQLHAAGAEIMVVQADIGNREEVKSLIARCTEFGPLRGIIHAAGLLDDGTINTQTVERFAKVMHPKVNGAWHLHTLTQEIPLDFFVCFSSLAALIGAPGQSNYAAANAFSDALMIQRRRRGLPGLSIQWGAWDSDEGLLGMAANLDSQQQRRQELEVRPLSSHQACKLASYLIKQDVAQVGVFDLNVQQLLQQPMGQPALFAALLAEQDVTLARASATALSTAGALYTELLALPAKARYEQLSQAIRVEVAQTLSMSASEEIALQQPLFELGVDSLMALELKNRLEYRLNAALHSTLFFDYPTTARVTEYLLDHLFTTAEDVNPDQAEENTASTEELSEQLAYVTELSDDEAEALLMEKLNAL